MSLDRRAGHAVAALPPVSLGEVERAIADDSVLLRFPPALEDRFDAETDHARRRHFVLTMMIGFLLYIGGIGGVFVMLPDDFAKTAVIEQGAGIPFLLGLMMLMLVARPPAWLRETAVATMCVVSAAGILLPSLGSNELASHFHYSTILIIVFTNVIYRIRLRYAFATSATILALYALTLTQLAPWGGDDKAALSAIMLMALTAVATLYANYTLERSERQAYLTQLRGQIRNGHLVLANEELSRISNLDPLTGMTNRRGFESHLAGLWPVLIENAQSVAMLMLDVDFFKRFNDRYGHQAGDVCLRRVAEAARAQLRDDDEIVARYGGEEFVILLPRADLLDGIRVAERIRRAIEARAIVNDAVPQGVVTVSIGIAAAPATRGGSAQSVIEAADAALYEAKARGRNRVWPPILSTDTELMIQAGGGELQAAGLSGAA